MMRKILAVGMILFLSSACLPHLGSSSEKTYYPSFLHKRRGLLSLPNRSRKSPLLRKSLPLLRNLHHLISPSSTENQMVWSLELPISDESNDDFSLEVLPKDRPKTGTGIRYPDCDQCRR